MLTSFCRVKHSAVVVVQAQGLDTRFDWQVALVMVRVDEWPTPILHHIVDVHAAAQRTALPDFVLWFGTGKLL
jgi:hypothetical protein